MVLKSFKGSECSTGETTARNVNIVGEEELIHK